MVKKENLDERLRRLNKHWDDVLTDVGIENSLPFEETTPQELTKFGLSLSQARAWLKREPNYLADEKKQLFNGNKKQTKRKQNPSCGSVKSLSGRFFCKFSSAHLFYYVHTESIDQALKNNYPTIAIYERRCC